MIRKPSFSREYLDPFQPSMRPRTLSAGDGWQGQPYLHLDETYAELCAGRQGRPSFGVVVDERFGTLIAGPVSLFAQPEQISLAGGYWRLNPLLLACVGSSAALNVPTLVRSQPEMLAAGRDLNYLGKMAGIGRLF